MRLTTVHELVQRLPAPNVRLLSVLLVHLTRYTAHVRARVSPRPTLADAGGLRRPLLPAMVRVLGVRSVRAHQQSNKMGTAQLGIVFSPLLQVSPALFALFLAERPRLFPSADSA